MKKIVQTSYELCLIKKKKKENDMAVAVTFAPCEYLCNKSCLAGWSAGCIAWQICTVDFCHFIPLSLTLTLPEGYNVSAKQKLLALFSCTLFI